MERDGCGGIKSKERTSGDQRCVPCFSLMLLQEYKKKHKTGLRFSYAPADISYVSKRDHDNKSV